MPTKTCPLANVSVRHTRGTRDGRTREINCLLIFFLKYYTFKETPELKRHDNFW